MTLATHPPGPRFPFGMDDIAEVLGLESPDLVARLRGGEALVQIAEEHGVSRDQLIDHIMEMAKVKAQVVVDEGGIGPRDVKRMLRLLRKQIEKRIDHSALEQVGPAGAGSGGPRNTLSSRGAPSRGAPSVSGSVDPVGNPFDLERVARALRLSGEGLRRALSEGATLEAVAAENDMSLRDLADLLIGPMQDRLTEMIDAGRLNRGQGRQMLDKMRKSAMDRLENFDITRHDGTGPGDARARLSPSFRPYKDIPFTLEDAADVIGISAVEVLEFVGGQVGLFRTPGRARTECRRVRFLCSRPGGPAT